MPDIERERFYNYFTRTYTDVVNNKEARITSYNVCYTKLLRVCTFKVELTPEGFKLSHAVTGSFPVEMFDILKATLTSELYKDN